MDNILVTNLRTQTQQRKVVDDVTVDKRNNYSGIWYCIHMLAAHVSTRDQLSGFLFFLNTIISSLKCLDCHNHSLAYIQHHPPSLPSPSNTKTIFEWSVDFHNSVNNRLKKKTLSYSDAILLYPHTYTLNSETPTLEIDNLPLYLPRPRNIRFE